MSKGLTNIGNTCYMNSALQCLLHLPILSSDNEELLLDIKKKSNRNDFGLMEEWIRLHQQMWASDGETVVNTRPIFMEFIRRCQKENVYFESFAQNDAQEFITLYIDFLHNSIKRSVRIEISGEPQTEYDRIKIESINSWKLFFESNYSYIINNFYSRMLSFTSCPNCKYVTNNHEPIATITLTLENEYITLYDCLNEFTSESTLDGDNSWKCDNCSQSVCPDKKATFWDLSSVLIFTVKQFRNGKKMNHHIEFPENLKMDKYCMNINKERLQYQLSGICIHSGSLNGGHYYAMCKNYKTNKWNIHNDSSVSETSIESVLKETPYCLFYQRIIS
jgi:ubiquitin C-terminal hydrolase